MSAAVRVGIAGLGTVGAGVLSLLQQHSGLIATRCGREVVPVAVSARDRSRDRGVPLDGYRWFDSATDLARDGEVDVVIELIGGEDGVAKAVVEMALEAGKPVVTANKALIAHHGTALASLAESHDALLAFEAAVAGGIPALKTLREGLSGNAIDRLHGILNGTCNYILSTMRESGRDFDEVLAEAQALGYAEADPSFDVDGVDAAHKLAILTSLAFGCEVDFGAVYAEGIRNITASDIAYAEELGYRIKLLGIAERSDGGVEQRVHPCMVSTRSPLAQVEGVFNAVLFHGDFVDNIMIEGRGAGAGPTASAVVADLLDIARGNAVPAFGMPQARLKSLPTLPMAQHEGCYYIRLQVVDRPGVMADVTAILRDEAISLEAMLQRGRAPGEPVAVVLTTHETVEARMQRALERIAALEASLEPPQIIRIEPI